MTRISPCPHHRHLSDELRLRASAPHPQLEGDFLPEGSGRDRLYGLVERIAAALVVKGHMAATRMQQTNAVANDRHIEPVGKRERGDVPVGARIDRPYRKRNFRHSLFCALSGSEVESHDDRHRASKNGGRGAHHQIPVDCHGRTSIRLLAKGRGAMAMALRPPPHLSRFAGAAS